MKKQTGFNLLEIIVTMSIVGILLAVGGPSLRKFVEGDQLVAASNELLSALHIARSEAIKLNTRVTICESSNGTSCSVTGDWSNGWVVFVDSNGDINGTGAACTGTGTDCLLRSHSGFTDNLLSVSGIDSNLAVINSFTFTPRGVPKDTRNISESGIFSVCVFDDATAVVDARAVVLGLSGRVRVSSDDAIIICPAAP